MPERNRRTTLDLTDDGTDQTAVIAEQLAAIPDGTRTDRRVVVFPRGQYRVDGGIKIVRRNHLDMRAHGFVAYTDSPGTELGIVDRNGRSTRAHLSIGTCEDIAVRGMSIVGSHVDRDADQRFAIYRESVAFEHGVAIQSSTNIRLLDTVVREVGGDALYIGGAGTSNRNIMVEGFVGWMNGRQAIGINNVVGGKLSNITITGSGRSGVDIEPNHDSHFVRNLTIQHVTMGSKFYPFIVGGDWGDSNPHVSDIT
ncbi:MAG: hypothetical protein ABIO83_02425, partial [Ilumatobacteraceae bacterium]